MLPFETHPEWPESFARTNLCDQLEIWGERFNAPYAELYRQRRMETLNALQNYCTAQGRILDLAAAGGNFTIAAAELGYQVTWNDLRSELVDYVKLKATEELPIEYLSGNIFELGSEWEQAFDGVMALEVIEHVAHPNEFLEKLSRLIKPDGTIIVSTPNGAYFRNDLPRFSDFPDPSIFESVQFQPNSDGHIFLLYEDEMRSLGEKAGLRMIDYRQFTNPLSAGHIKLRHLHKVIPQAVMNFQEILSRKLPARLVATLMTSSLAIYRK